MQQIIATGNDYLIAVKGNQPKLLGTLQAAFVHQTPLSRHTQRERTRNRDIEPRVSVLEAPQELSLAWVGAKRMIRVERQGIRAQQPFLETVFYLSSMTGDAQTFAQYIRHHWQIENRLHWPKDAVLKEDITPVCDGHAMTNFALVRTIALNLFRRHGFDSITRGIRMLAHDVKTLFSFFQ